MKNLVYLCHKCAGLLTPYAGPVPAYKCGCISGYVRDWQLPIDDDKIAETQIEALKALLKLYAGQGRGEQQNMVVHARERLALLTDG